MSAKLAALSTTDITSRDQIINPYEFLGSPDGYGYTRSGKALYNTLLEQAKLIAQQQEASYIEWYESSEQQAVREREAGINPDLAGLADNAAVQTTMPSTSPTDGLLTNGEVALNAFNMLSSIIGAAGAAAGLATTFSQLNINKATEQLVQGQADAQTLSNLRSFEESAYGTITDRLSTAISAAGDLGQTFDIDSWFADENNFSDILGTYAPNDDVRYSTSLASIRKGSQSILSKAYKQSQTTGENRMGFAKVLADPYHTTDAVLTAAILSPVMDAIRKYEQLNTDANSARADVTKRIIEGVDIDKVVQGIDAGNSRSVAENNFYTEYYNAADGSQFSVYDLMQKKGEAIAKGAAAAIYQNLWDIYENDPTSLEGRAAAFQIGSGLHLSWQEYLVINGLDIGSNFIKQAIDEYGYMDTDGNPITNEGVLGWNQGRPTK